MGLILWSSLLMAVMTSCFFVAEENGFVKEMRNRAGYGDRFAQNEMGYLYYNGYGVPCDYEQAFKWFDRAATNDYSLGQYNLALCYMKGEGTTKDLVKAVQYMQKSANHGCAQAELSLGCLLIEGVGVVADKEKAKYWLERAANHGHTDAMYILGNLYLDEGVRDEAKALYWIRQAAYYGLPEAQCHYGCLFRDGILVKRDMEKYFRWIIRANQNGYASSRYGEYYAGICLLGLTQTREPITDKIYLLQSPEEEEVDSEAKALYKKGFDLLFGNEMLHGNNEAINCLIRSTVKGNKSAKILLSYCCATGTGTLQKPLDSAALFVGKGRIKYKDASGYTTIDFEIFEDGSFDKKMSWERG